MKIKITFIAIILAAGLFACSAEPPKCSDPETVALIRQIIVDNRSGINLPDLKLSSKELEDMILIQNPRSSGYDGKIKKYSCEGTLIVRNKVDDLQYKGNIKYASQLDDKKQHIVMLDGFSIFDSVLISTILSKSMPNATQQGQLEPVGKYIYKEEGFSGEMIITEISATPLTWKATIMTGSKDGHTCSAEATGNKLIGTSQEIEAIFKSKEEPGVSPTKFTIKFNPNKAIIQVQDLGRACGVKGRFDGMWSK